LADLIDREEHAIVQRAQAAKCLNEWSNVLAWLSTVDGLPIFESWIKAAFQRVTADRAQQARMKEMLDNNYPRSECTDWGDKADLTYSYTRLLGLVQRLVREGQRP
jgi:hypothetical protein